MSITVKIFTVRDNVFCISGLTRGLRKAIAENSANDRAKVKVIISSWSENEFSVKKNEFEKGSLEVMTIKADVCIRAVGKNWAVLRSVDMGKST